MSWRRIGAITLRLFTQARRDPLTLGLLFVTPLVILALLYFLMRTTQPAPAVDLVNLDSGPVGAAVAGQLQHSPLVTATPRTDERAAEDRLQASRTAGYVVLSADFSRRAQEQGEVRPVVRLDGSDPSSEGIVMQAVSQAVAKTLATAEGGPRLDPDVSYVYGTGSLDTFDYFGGAFIALLLFFLVFVITSISFLRERTQGTLERLMASPLRRTEVVIGYMLAFSAMGLIQATELLVFALWFLKVYNGGNVLVIFSLEVLIAVSAVNLGILVSMMSRTEFQAMQSIPIIMAPQLLLSGTIFSISAEPRWLQVVSQVLPLTYAVDGMHQVMLKGTNLASSRVQLDAAVLLAFCVLTVLLAGFTLRHRA